MSSDSDQFSNAWLVVPRRVRRLPADLAAVVVAVAVTDLVVLVPGVARTPLRALAVPFVLFVPGYAVVAALFPQAAGADSNEATGLGDSAAGIDRWTERLALSVGVSVVVVAFVGFGLASAWRVRVLSASVALSAVTLAATAFAAHRRYSLPPDERFAVPYDRWLATVRAELFDADGRRETAVNVALAMGLLLATASVAYAVAMPGSDQRYTEFYLLTENETGDLVVADYRASFETGTPRPLHVGVTNHEGRPMEYVVVAERRRVTTENDATRVRERRELSRQRITVGANESWTGVLDVAPVTGGEQVRLAVYLYRGDAPARPSRATAYRSLRLGENVTSPGTGTPTFGAVGS